VTPALIRRKRNLDERQGLLRNARICEASSGYFNRSVLPRTCLPPQPLLQSEKFLQDDAAAPDTQHGASRSNASAPCKAEGEGFEPPELLAQLFSRQPQSSTLPSLRDKIYHIPDDFARGRDDSLHFRILFPKNWYFWGPILLLALLWEARRTIDTTHVCRMPHPALPPQRITHTRLARPRLVFLSPWRFQSHSHTVLPWRSLPCWSASVHHRILCDHQRWSLRFDRFWKPVRG
jgi:hypothetical protein